MTAVASAVTACGSGTAVVAGRDMLEGHHEPVMIPDAPVSVHKEIQEPNAVGVQLSIDNQSAVRTPVTQVRVDSREEDRANNVIVASSSRQRRRQVKVVQEKSDDTQKGAVDVLDSHKQSAVKHDYSSLQLPLSLPDRIQGCGGQGTSGACVDGGEGDGGKGVEGEGSYEGNLCLPTSSSPGTEKIVYFHSLGSKVTPASAFDTSAVEDGMPPDPAPSLQKCGKKIAHKPTNNAADEGHCDTAFISANDSGFGGQSAAENARLAGILRAALRAVAASSSCDSIPKKEEPSVKVNAWSRCPAPAGSSGCDIQSSYFCSRCSYYCGDKSCLLLEKTTQTEPETEAPTAAAASAAATAASTTTATAAAALQALAKEKAKVTQ